MTEDPNKNWHKNSFEEDDLTQHEEMLSELQGGSPLCTDKDTILLIDSEDRMRALLGRPLPNYRVHRAKGDPKQVSEEVMECVVMIVDLSSHDGSDPVFTHDESSTDLSRTPIIVQPASLLERGSNDQLAAVVKSGKVDGALEFPTTLRCVEVVVADAINKRLIPFRENEAIARAQVLKDFSTFFDTCLAEWQAGIRELKEDSRIPIEDLETIETQFPASYELADELRRKGADIKIEDLQRIIHDLNNKLTVMLGNTAIITMDPGLEDKTMDIAKRLENSFRGFHKYATVVQQGYHETDYTAWTDIIDGKYTDVPEPQSLELPEGANVLVIDDSDEVLSLCARVISQAGGNYFEAKNSEAIAAYKKELGEEAFDVILLDNNLGNGNTGDSFIPLLRQCYPNALILAHTGDANSLKCEPANPYTSAGVDIVGKHQWNEITEILKAREPLTE